MSIATTPKLLAAACLAAGLFLALPGCGGKTDPPKADAGKDKTKPGDQPSSDPTGKKDKKDPNPTPPTGPGEGEAQKAAAEFLKAAGEGNPDPTRLTAGFLKVIGKPLAFDADKKHGYSADEARSWLVRAAGGLTFGLPSGPTAGGVALLSGSFQGQDRSGRYLLRLVPEGGAWKVDWFQVASVKADPGPASPGSDGPAQDFAAQAFLDAVADSGALPPAARVRLAAGVMSAQLKSAWAAPFGQDKDRGYDYQPAALELRLKDLGAGGGSYSRTRPGADPVYAVELTAGGGKKGYTLRLVKGAGPGEWLVDAFDPRP
jgi:hypothetical protein